MLARGTPLAAALAALAVLGGCGGDDKADDAKAYPAAVERNFLAGCKKQGGDRTTCKCTLRKVQERFSYDEFKKEDTAVAAGRTPSRKLTDAIAECR